jgi:hypothetical protein
VGCSQLAILQNGLLQNQADSVLLLARLEHLPHRIGAGVNLVQFICVQRVRRGVTRGDLESVRQATSADCVVPLDRHLRRQPRCVFDDGRVSSQLISKVLE